ncbi:pantetheine-phosphate adenylyltransferase [Acetilactobacillus jinshanensis]|uniref:Phosphopantetheine adenylyltransferase n=1 Tax=Acetilactobacillus jinshanensis TaxID=1720083 RepID=A0A4P6ZKG5_9LACO|nr:pantetheine-phosphate adenylyltransferase [Acetilactobacillus jinshanensis]QBP17922.1 pantetheine-phosphate adenylyltransferase [Acetilactobacillus jinshanensis]URL60785.1 pantetheine-phosphate adenylyltransferase [uncultured bacterium]
MKIAVYPGSFDPVTLGHIDLIKRSHRLFDKLIVAVGNNMSKKYMFTQEQRINLIKANVQSMKNVQVVPDKGLTIKLTQHFDSHIIIRGLRNSRDLDYEQSIANINHHLDPDVETIFLLARPKYQAISSSILKETFHYGGNISAWVPKNVLKAMNRVQKNHEE